MTAAPGFARQSTARTAFRVVGVVSMLVALTLITTSFVDFFVHGDSMAGPTKFWMFFLALPFFAVGGACLQAGFLGAAARYGAGETMPVAKDSAAYLTDGRGLLGVGRTPGQATAAGGPYCRSCGTRNDADARYCDSCGASVA